MVKWIDIDPDDPTDDLKKLLGRADNKQTVPVGVKVARADERMVFYDSTQVSHTWDGDTIADYDARISAAQAAIAEAEANLARTQADLASAEERIQASTGDLSVYVDRIDKAQADVSAAQMALDELESSFSTTKSDVSALSSRTNAVESAVSSVDVRASQAQSDASSASDVAQRALVASQQVQADAQNALSVAEDAQTKALENAGLVASKGRVFFQAEQPTGSSSDLWIDSDDNKPYIWDAGAGLWKPVTDKAAVDAANSAAQAINEAKTAQDTANKAVKDAANAAASAQAAQTAAGNAQKSADGKTVVQYGTATPPPNTGVVRGDIYYYTGSDNRIIEQWQWSGTVWVKRAVDAVQLANLDAGYITSGYLDVAKRIKAGSVYADKLSVGIGENIVPNGGGQSSEGWANFTYVPGEANGFPGSFALQGFKAPISSIFPVSPGNYRFTCSVKGENDGGKFYAKLNFYDNANNRVGGIYPVSNASIPNGTWQTFSSNVTIPSNVSKVSIGIYSQHSNGTQDSTKSVWYTGFSLREMKDGSLIVNGSITGDKVNAQSVAATVGDFVKVKATNVEVTGDLAARVVNAMDVSAKRLVVTEDALLNNATFLGNTVADQLNVTKKLVARDAIVNGTLDVAQLNVTEQMSAQIVSAMSLESKKLVVTEDAIFNRATVVESIVTPQLIAEKINVKQLGADLVTAGAIQTNTAASRGIKISNSGLTGYDDAGNLTMDFNGKNNKLIGNLSTSSDAYTGINLVHRGTVAGIELYSGTKTANNSLIYSHGAVWYSTPDFPPDDRGMFICATDKSAVQDPDPGIWLKPSSGIGFQGSFTRNSPAFTSGVVEHASIAAGGWVALDVKFLPAMQPGTNVQVHICPVTESGVECSIGYQNVTNTGFKANVVNESPRASGYMWIKWFAIAIR